jgi:hypothetical protein
MSAPYGVVQTNGGYQKTEHLSPQLTCFPFTRADCVSERRNDGVYDTSTTLVILSDLELVASSEFVGPLLESSSLSSKTYPKPTSLNWNKTSSAPRAASAATPLFRKAVDDATFRASRWATDVAARIGIDANPQLTPFTDAEKAG